MVVAEHKCRARSAVQRQLPTPNPPTRPGELSSHYRKHPLNTTGNHIRMLPPDAHWTVQLAGRNMPLQEYSVMSSPGRHIGHWRLP